MMRVSIIIPYFNSSKYLNRIRASIDSYFSDNNIEIIFINDCSGEEETLILKSFISDLNLNNIIYLCNIENQGASISRKIGVENARGDYVAFLDSDDAWLDNKLYAQLEYMENNKFDITGGFSNIVTAEQYFSLSDFSKKRKINLIMTGKKINLLDFLYKNHYSPTSTVMVKRSVILARNFSEKLRYSEDYECWRRISIDSSCGFVDETNTYSFKHSYLSDGNSLSSNLIKMSIGELKGFIMLYKENLKLIYYFLIPFAIFFSILKSSRRLFLFLLAR